MIPFLLQIADEQPSQGSVQLRIERRLRNSARSGLLALFLTTSGNALAHGGISSVEALAYLYGFISLVGALVGFLTVFFLYRHYRNPWIWLLFPVVAVAAGILFYLTFSLWTYGFVSVGGALVGFLTAFFLYRRYRNPWIWLLFPVVAVAAITIVHHAMILYVEMTWK